MSSRENSRIGRSLPACLALLAACGLACETAPGARSAVVDYLQAVQNRDLDRLYCLSAGAARPPAGQAGPTAPREEFDAWAEAQYEVYLEGRDRGFVELADEPIRVVKAYALGKGTFYTWIGSRTPEPGAVELFAELRMGYPQLDLSALSPGTTFYVNAVPPGRVVPVRVPAEAREVDEEVLDTVTVVWTLVRSEPTEACPGEWTVASASPLADSATTTDVTWFF